MPRNIRRTHRSPRRGLFAYLCTKFYDAIIFSEERRKDDSKVQVAGNNTLLGQIATFMETLHVSYREAVYEIPYRNLIIMQRDKLHEVYGDIVKEKKARDNPKLKKNANKR